ncbi:MAG: hypothetical protein WBL21_00040 [Salinimicrobium sp.]
MIYILKNIGKGKIGSGERQLDTGDLILIQQEVTIPIIPESQPPIQRFKNYVLYPEIWDYNEMNTPVLRYHISDPSFTLTDNTYVEIIPIPSPTTTQGFETAGILPYTEVVAADRNNYEILVYGNGVVPQNQIVVDIIFRETKPLSLAPKGGGGGPIIIK